MLLSKILDNGGAMPDEVEAGYALIERAIRADGSARACCEASFDSFVRNLSSYARARFPHAPAIVGALGSALETFPSAPHVFRHNPWLSSNKSSWRDFVRIVESHLLECWRMYGSPRRGLREVDWLNLVHALVDSSVSRDSLKDCLRGGRRLRRDE